MCACFTLFLIKLNHHETIVRIPGSSNYAKCLPDSWLLFMDEKMPHLAQLEDPGICLGEDYPSYAEAAKNFIAELHTG